jgi:hypothetical protein
MVGGGQAGTSAVWLAAADVDWRELKERQRRDFRPLWDFRLITPNHLRGE